MNNKLKPAVIGGVVLGLLSAIPFVNFVNFCCCAWAILGGLLASYLYVKNSATPANAGDGAIIGAMAGGIGAAIYLVIGIPLALVSGAAMRDMMISLVANVDPRQADLMRGMAMQGESVASTIIQGFIAALLLVVFSIVGGLIGIALFEKRKGGGPVPPPPPPAPGGAPYAA